MLKKIQKYVKSFGIIYFVYQYMTKYDRMIRLLHLYIIYYTTYFLEKNYILIHIIYFYTIKNTFLFPFYRLIGVFDPFIENHITSYTNIGE